MSEGLNELYLVKNIAIQKIHIQNARLNSLYTEKLIKYNKKRFSPPKVQNKSFQEGWVCQSMSDL